MKEHSVPQLLDEFHKLEVQNQQLKEELSQLRQMHQDVIKATQQRQELEVSYHQSQLRFQTVFEQSLLGNKILASDLFIRQLNPALVALLGYTHKEEIIGTRILDYAHPDYKQHWQWLQDRLWRQRIPNIKLETCLLRKDGSLIWVRVTSILIKDNGEWLGYTILENITERKELEEINQRFSQAQEVMVHTVAHDLKTPIHVINTLCTSLRKNIEQGIDSQNRDSNLHYLTMVEDSCRNAYTILEDLLLIGQLEDSRILPVESIDLKALIERELETNRLMASQKEITIEFHCSLDSLLAPINSPKMTRALANLLSNAVKFSHPQSLITIELSNHEGKARLAVRDQGIGIAASLQDTVFERFTKANRKGTWGEGTTGLGLFIVKRIVELHDGNIWLESQSGQGTSFYIELPIY
jgi:two-component system sensor histidine kinase VicK